MSLSSIEFDTRQLTVDDFNYEVLLIPWILLILTDLVHALIDVIDHKYDLYGITN
jgi:hypothetical protein